MGNVKRYIYKKKIILRGYVWDGFERWIKFCKVNVNIFGILLFSFKVEFLFEIYFLIMLREYLFIFLKCFLKVRNSFEFY